MKTIAILGVIVAAGLTFSGCHKEQGTSTMNVRMVDAPGDFQQVNVEVLGVQVHHDAQGWVSLPTVTGVYDLLTLQNDVSAVLVNTGQIPSGNVSQIRLLLGSHNSVMVDSTMYDLATPSAQQSGLKINVGYNFQPNETYELTLDFDAAKSIVIQGNGSYSLKPVLKILSITSI